MCKKEKIMKKLEEVISTGNVSVSSNHTAVISKKENETVFITIFNKAIITSPAVYILLQNENGDFVSAQKQDLSLVTQKTLSVSLNSEDLCKYINNNHITNSLLKVVVCYELNNELCFKYLWNDRLKKKSETDKENQKISGSYSLICNDKNYNISSLYGEKNILTVKINDTTFSLLQKGAFKLNSCISDDETNNIQLEISKKGRISDICKLYAFKDNSSECIELPFQRELTDESIISKFSSDIFSLGEWTICGKFISDGNSCYGGLKTGNTFEPFSVKSDAQNRVKLKASADGMLRIICESTLTGLKLFNKQLLADDMYFPEDFLASEESRPKGRCRAEMNISEKNTLDVKLFENFHFAEELRIAFYDTKNNNLLFERIAEYISEDTIRIKYSKNDMTILERKEDMCIRICLCAFSKNAVYYLYLTKLNEDILNVSDNGKCNYIKPLHTFINSNNEKYLCSPFYDKNGLMSIRKIKENERYINIINNNVTNLEVNKNSIHVEIECVPMDNSEYTNLIIRPKCGIKDIPDDYKVSINCSKSTDINGNIILSADINLNELNLKPMLYDVFCQLDDNSLISVKSDDKFIKNYKKQEHKSEYTSDEGTIYAFTMFNNEKQLLIRCSASHYEYAVSIIMAVYNTELFIEEAVDSIIYQQLEDINKFCACCKHHSYQNIGFSEPIQIILVDDGASDSSGMICDKYAERYDNITVIHKPNGGVSSARNEGLKYAKGKYLNFIDSDDKFEETALEKMFTFFENNYDAMEIATMPINFFDAASGGHWLNTKFEKGNRIINLRSEFNSSLLFVNASFFKAELIMPDIRFDESLVTGEDSKFIYTIFLRNNCRFGVVTDTSYLYRRRSQGEGSAIQASKLNRNFYFDYLDNFIDWIASYSKELNGFIPKYVQYVIAQQLQWRFVQDKDAEIAKSVLTEEEFEQYKNHLFAQLNYIDDEIILMQKMIYREQKMYMLMKKHNAMPSCEFFDDDANLYYGNNTIGLVSSCYTRIDFLKIHNNTMTIEGYTMMHGCENPDDINVFLSLNDEFIKCSLNKNRDMSIYALAEPIFHSICFSCQIPLDSSTDKYKLEIYVEFNNHMILKKDIRFNKNSPINTVYDNSYYAENGWVVTFQKPHFIIQNLFAESNSDNLQDYEMNFEKSVQRKRKNDIITLQALELRRKFFAYNSIYNKRKDIWLISDRVNLAGDNGEAFFLYMLEKNDPDVDFYFVINDDCPDYNRLIQYGKVVVQNSQQHKLLHLMADVIVSAHANEYVIDPFFNEGTTDIFRNIIYRAKYVFLQHGVIKDDLSDWLNRYKKNISGFITAAHPEYQSILDYNYFYSPKEVWLTGLPRHDRLYHDEKKYITVMPTWRKYLTNPEDDSLVSDDFNESEFFCFYNELLNNERLIASAKENGYQLCFMPHPNIMQHLDLFNHHKDVIFFGTEKPYREIYAESNLVMTDFSSSIMDFAYLRKPVVYCQFDKEKFFDGDHVYVQGYFDYERDGFGEVTYTIDEVVDVMISYMENNCQLKDIYKKRMDEFFAYNDKKNCERVYLKIKDMLADDRKN